MTLQLEQSTGRHVITGYGSGYVAVNHVRYQHAVLVMSNLVQPWDVSAFSALVPDHLAGLLALSPEMVLLGTGATTRFPQPTLVRLLSERGVGLEAMDTPAACRTFNILIGEGRRVLAALLVE